MIGDVLSVKINPTAYQAEIIISGFPTGQTYIMGFGENTTTGSPAAPKVKFTVLSSGFDNNTDPTTLYRTIYGLTGLRLPYPNQLSKDETTNPSGMMLKMVLSDFIYKNDSQITVDILSGFYISGYGNSNSTGNNAISSYSVVNQSALQYPKVIANWSWPPYDRITKSTHPLRCVAFHRSAQQGKPVRAVKFIANDEHGNYMSGIITDATIDNSMPDAVPVIEYIYNVPTTGFTTGDYVSGNFHAFPWYGDTGSVLKTDDGVNSPGGTAYAPLPLLCDTSGNYGITVVVVDSITGNNLAGEVVNLASFDTGNPPPAYATIHSGARAIVGYNNTGRARNDIGAGIIYLKSGNHFFASGTANYGNTPKTYGIITRFPGESKDNVTISNQNGDKNLSNKIHVSGIRLVSSSSETFTDVTNLWLNDCFINNNGNALVYNNSKWYVTHCLVPALKQGFRPFSTEQTPPVLIRGNNLSGFAAGKALYTNCVIGNIRTTGDTNYFASIMVVNGGLGMPTTPILAYN